LAERTLNGTDHSLKNGRWGVENKSVGGKRWFGTKRGEEGRKKTPFEQKGGLN